MKVVDQHLINKITEISIDIDIGPVLGMTAIALFICVWVWGRQDN